MAEEACTLIAIKTTPQPLGNRTGDEDSAMVAVYEVSWIRIPETHSAFWLLCYASQ